MTVNKTKQEENVPKLRFSEFEGKWKEKRLGDVGSFVGGGTPSKSVEKYWKGDVPWVSSSDICEGSVRDINITRFINGDAVKSSATKLVPKNGVLIVSRVGVGKFAVAPKDLCTSQDFTNFITKQNPYFFAYNFKSKPKRFFRLIQGTSIQGVSSRDIAIIKLMIPSLIEQHKIASFLSAVDEWVGNLKGQKREWEMYKKGLMQKMFPSEDRQAPEIRFKDEGGKEFPEWEEKRLGALGTTVNGLTGKTKEDFGEGEPFINYKQIFDCSKINTDKFSFVRIKEEDKQNKIKFGDVLFTTSSETPLEVGFSSVLLDHNVGPYLNSFAFALRPNSLKQINPYFARFFFRSSFFRNKVIRLAQGSTRFNLSKIALMKIHVSLPMHDEQEKISSFLGSVDEVIDSYQQKITRAEEWKKGLMQKMFI